MLISGVFFDRSINVRCQSFQSVPTEYQGDEGRGYKRLKCTGKLVQKGDSFVDYIERY